MKSIDSLIVSNPLLAEEYLIQLIENSNSQETASIGNYHRTLAKLYAVYSRKSEELDQLILSHKCFQESANEKEAGESLRLIGRYYLMMRLDKKAEKYLTHALTNAIQFGDTITQIKVISNMAQLAEFRKNSEQSILLYQECIALSEKIGYREGLLINWNRLSYIYKISGQPNKMLASIRQAFAYKTRNADTLGVLYSDLGFAYLENGAIDSAELNLLKGYELIARGGNLVQRMLVAEKLAALYQQLQDYKRAYAFLQITDSLRNTLFTDRLSNHIEFSEKKHKKLNSEIELRNLANQKKWFVMASISGLIIIGLMGYTIFCLRLRNKLIQYQKTKLDSTLKKLHSREILIQELYDKSPSFIFTHQLDGKIISANQAAITNLELEFDQLKGKPVFDFIPELDHDELRTFKNDLQQKGSSNGWIKVLDKNGKQRILRYHSSIINNQDDPYAVTFALDDTETYNARLETERQRQRLLSVMENSPDIYSILKEDGTIAYVNNTTILDNQDIFGLPIHSFLPSDIAKDIDIQLKKAFSTRLKTELEVPFKGRIFLVKLIPVISNNKVKEVLSVSTDITESKKREESELKLKREIEINEKRYRDLVEGSMVLICSHDEAGIILTVNTPGAKSMGYDPSEIIGKRLDYFIHDDYKNEFYSYMGIIIKDGIYQGFMTIERKDGEKRIFLCRNVYLRDENIILGSAQDVTEWKKAEYREKQIKKELQIAKEQAEESNRLKTIFLGSLSHEIRTPLQSILGFAEILENPLPEIKRKEYLKIIKRRTSEMQNLIEALLDMASVETGEIKAYPVEVNLYEFAEETFKKFNQDFQTQKPIRFIFENNIPVNTLIYIDIQHLNQVIINLFSNAIKFTNAGVIKLSFSKQVREFIVCINDTGIGIDNTKLDQIFMPFRQVHEGISRSKGGIGLGLAISKKLVELWGGKITIDSTPGEGTKFCISIPG